MKRALLVMNPHAGQRRANRFLPEIIGIFNAAGYEVTAYMTACQGDASRIVRERGEFADQIVCIGGDGTLNECVSGILQAGLRCPIGYIPAGTTNDFAASLKLPTGIVQAAQVAANGEPVPCDAGRFANRFFSYVASFGAFSRTSYTTSQNVKNVLGHVAYVLEGIQELSQIRKIHLRFELDDGVVEDDFIFGAICNSTSVGGILTLDPKQVDMGDGLFELLLVRSPRDLAELAEGIRALKTQSYNCAMLTFRPTSRLQIYADPDMPWTLDGEREQGHAAIAVENLHHAIRIIRGKDAL